MALPPRTDSRAARSQAARLLSTAIVEPISYSDELRSAATVGGAHIIDADGVARLDLICGFGAIVLGHDEAELLAAREAPSPHDHAIAAELLDQIYGGGHTVFAVDRVQARALALVAAKNVTGRDGAFFCGAEASGRGDVVSLSDSLRAHADEIAAVILDPSQADPGFAREARRLCDIIGAALIFDEADITLRFSPAQRDALGVSPDATILGEGLANGWSLGAAVGRRDLLSQTPQLSQPTAENLAAAVVTLRRASEADAPERLSAIGERFAEHLGDMITSCSQTQGLFITGSPGLLQFASYGLSPDAYEARLNRFLIACRAEGLIMSETVAFSLAHTDADVDTACAAVQRVVQSLASPEKSRRRSARG